MKLTLAPLALAAALAAIAALPCRADDAASNAVAVTTLLSDGTTNAWTQADLVAALQLMNRKYHRDVETDSGRRAWHGKLVKQVVDTNALVKVSTYADGTEFRDPFKVITPAASAAAKAAAISVTTNGLPARLAAARLRRATEKAAVSNVTVIVNAKSAAEQLAAQTAAALSSAASETSGATSSTPDGAAE